MSSQAEQRSAVLGEPTSAQVSASIFSRSSVRAVLLRSTAAAIEGPVGQGPCESHRSPSSVPPWWLVSTSWGFHANMANKQQDQLEDLTVPTTF